MNIKLFFSIVFFSFLFIPLNVFAINDAYNNHLGCTYSDMSKLKTAAALVKFSYEYDAVSLMTVTASNLQEDFYITDYEEGIYRYDATRIMPGVASIGGYSDDQIIEVEFIASDSSVCANEKLLSQSIKLPRYNVYYGNKACEGVDPDKFSLCSKWYPTMINEYDFLVRVAKYKNAIREAAETTNPEVEKDDTILDLIIDNYYYILLSILGLTSILIIIFSRIENKRRVL